MKYIVLLDDKDHYTYAVNDSPDFMHGEYSVYKFLSESEKITYVDKDSKSSVICICTHAALLDGLFYPYDIDSKRTLRSFGRYKILDSLRNLSY